MVGELDLIDNYLNVTFSQTAIRVFSCRRGQMTGNRIVLSTRSSTQQRTTPPA